MSQVEVSVRSRLNKIVEDLQAISKESERVGSGLAESSKKISKTQQDGVRQTQNYLGNLRRFAATTAKEIADDFKALMSLQGIDMGMKLSDQFKSNVKETVQLSDAIRRLGSVFGLSKDKFTGFQTAITKGLGDIGLSSESATRSLEGLAKTQVRGQQNLIEYSKVSGQLAQTAGEKESEGRIAQGMASVLTAKGVDPNDIGQVKNLAEDLRRGFNATGMSATEILSSMQDMYEGMSSDFRKALSTRAMVSMAVTRQVAGPQSTAFLEQYVKKSKLDRAHWEGRGFSGVFSDKGLDIEKFRKSAGALISSYKQDPRKMAQTLGLSEDAAEGFVRLYESIDRVDKAQKDMQASTGTLAEQYRQSMGASEAFQASLNKTKSLLAQPLAWVTQKGTEALAGASESTGGALAVSGGAALASAVLAGGGLRGLFNMAKGGVKAQAYEAITGENVTPVNVVNAAEIGNNLGTSMSGILGKVGIAAGVGAASYVGTQALMDPDSPIVKWQRENIPGFESINASIESAVMSAVSGLGTAWGNLSQGISKGADVVGNAMNGRPSNVNMNSVPQRQDVHVKVKVETAPNLKAQVKTNRGPAQ